MLNNYYADTEEAEAEQPVRPANAGSDEDEEEEEQDDIATQLANEIKASKVEAKKSRFQVVDTQTTNCVFIDAKIEDPLSLGVKIVRDIASTKVAKTRFLLRLLPVEIVCRANLTDMLSSAERLFDKHFLGPEPKSYAIMFNRRYNNDIKRDEVIKEFAEIIQAKNHKHKVDLKTADVSVIVEVMKGFCCLSVVPEYLALKKYNLVELCANTNPAQKAAEAAPSAEVPSVAADTPTTPDTLSEASPADTKDE